MDLGIAGKTALVTGGSKGIGREICRQLAQAGVNIAVVARSQGPIDETVDLVRGLGVKAIGISADLLDLGSYARITAEMTDAIGPADIAIYNLDAPPSGHFSDIDEEMLTQAYHMIVVCYARMLRVVLPHMQQQGWGRVVTIGSGTAKQLVRGGLDFGYVLANATRVAAAALAKTVATEVAGAGITINTIGTGYIDTANSRSFSERHAANINISLDDFTAGMVKHIPVGRKGTPEEMAALCAFLCSSQAGFTTGETILCDGGQSNSIL